MENIAAEKAEEQRDKIAGFLGKKVVDGFKTRMCVDIDIKYSENEFSARDFQTLNASH